MSEIPANAVFRAMLYAKSPRAQRRELVLAWGTDVALVMEQAQEAWTKLPKREKAKWREDDLRICFDDHRGETRWLANPEAYAAQQKSV